MVGDSVLAIDGEGYESPLDAARLLSGAHGTSVEVSVIRNVGGYGCQRCKPYFPKPTNELAMDRPTRYTSLELERRVLMSS